MTDKQKKPKGAGKSSFELINPDTLAAQFYIVRLF